MNSSKPQIDRHRSPLNELQFKTPMPVSVVIPCYNERDSLFCFAQSLADLRSNHETEFDFQFIFVNDGSSDETHQLLHDHFGTWPNVSILRHAKNLGMTAAIMTGVAHASNEAVCSIDSDCTYRPELVTKLVPLLGGDVVLATASPYHPQGQGDQCAQVANWIVLCGVGCVPSNSSQSALLLHLRSAGLQTQRLAAGSHR